MIKSKLRISPGSYLPYFAALLALVSAVGYLLKWQTTGTQYRFYTVLDEAFPALEAAKWLQFGAMMLLVPMMLFAAKRSLLSIAIPALLYAIGTMMLTLEDYENNYPLLLACLIFFWFLVVTSLSVFHSKWPLCAVEIFMLAVVALFCLMGKVPFVVQDPVMGKCYDVSLLLQICGYYGSMLVLSLAISKKFNMETITATTHKEIEQEAMPAKEETQEQTQGSKEQEGEPVPEVVEAVQETVNGTAEEKEPAATVPIAGSRLQKVLKEDTVYDRDQRLMYKKKVNIFSVLGLILSALTVVLGIVITFQLVNTPVLQNDAIGLPMLAMGLFMACIFGTRVTYKEYYTKTIVTERKVVREESNWEEVLASRLEEDEQSIAVLTDNYTRMTELYAKLLENTSELMKCVNQLGAAQKNPELEEQGLQEEPEIQIEPESLPESAPEVLEYADLEDQVVFDEEFLREEGIEEAFPTDNENGQKEEEPVMPESAEEIAESEQPVLQAEERRRRLQEKLEEIYRRNQELQRMYEGGNEIE